jgi:hypothetical protein
MTIDRQGLAFCSRYAFAPNLFHYCGPERQNDLFEYIATGMTDRGLADIMGRFETLYPYLKLIAAANHISDPFDPSVVEAYWLGNRLLSRVPKRSFAGHLEDTLGLRRKTPVKDFAPMMDRAMDGVPNHTFHVLNIFTRTGHHAISHTVSTMDQCRISWGRVEKGVSSIKNQVSGNESFGKQYVIKTQALTYQGGLLKLGSPVMKVVTGIGLAPKVGDWVSVHWGYICDVLTPRERMLLSRYTGSALAATNAHTLQTPAAA